MLRRIKDESDRIRSLDSRLVLERTPYAKAKLRMALNFLEDSKSALRGHFNGDSNNLQWLAFAGDSLERARQLREEVQSATHDGAENILELDEQKAKNE